MTSLELFPGTRSTADELPDDRYTTRQTMDWCKRRVGVEAWDLDVAACQASHWAKRWYGLAENGLEQPWFGKVWCNPPFSDLAPWVLRAWGEIHRCELIAMLLPANRCEQPFWQEHVEPFRDGRGAPGEASLTTHHLPGRVQFGTPGNPQGINTKNSPPFGCVLLIWRPA